MNRLGVLQKFGLKALRFVGSQTSTQLGSDGEQRLTLTLRKSFPKAMEISVSDISGGCGAMYDIAVESIEFQGKNRVEQHRMVNEALKEEIKDMHGLRITTNIPNT